MNVYQHHSDTLKSHIKFVHYTLSLIWCGTSSLFFEATILQNRFAEEKGKVRTLRRKSDIGFCGCNNVATGFAIISM